MAKQLKAKMSQVDEGNVSHVQLFLVDENDNRVSSEEVVRGFQNFEYVGVYVLRTTNCPRNFPLGGVIDEILDDYVFIDGVPVPRTNFLKWYELD